MIKLAVSMASVTVLTGCASSLMAFTHRPVVEDNVHETLSTVSLSADRRTVIIMTNGANKGKFCAEPPPDTATGLKTELEASAEAAVKKAAIEASVRGAVRDATETTIAVIAERTAALDAFRTGVYSLCQFHLNGAIGAGEVRPMFEKLIDSFAATYKPAVPVVAAAPAPAAASANENKPAAAPSAANAVKAPETPTSPTVPTPVTRPTSPTRPASPGGSTTSNK